MPLALLLANAVSTWYLTGLIWTVQRVHYPGFAYVAEEGFERFALFHQMRITPIVAPIMIVELFTAIALVYLRPGPVPVWIVWLGVVLTGLIWVSTFAVQVPLHGRLEQGADPVAVSQLVATNWIRTLAWSARALLMGWAVWLALGAR